MLFRVATLPIAGLLLAAQPADPARQIAAGQELLQKREWRTASERFNEVLKSSPRNLDALTGMGSALWALGNRPQAVEIFRRAVQAHPSSSRAHFNLALALRDTDQVQAAINEAKAAIALKPAFDEARLALGIMLQQRGDTTAAVVQYRQILKNNPRSAEAHNWLGVAYMQQNRLADAATSLRTAIQLKPDFVRAYSNLGSTLAQAGDLQAGIEAFQRGLQFAPDDLSLHLNLGTALRTKGDAGGAIEQFEFVLKRDPGNPEIHHQLGLAWREKGDLDVAVREFETSLRLDPEYRDGYYVLGQTLRQMAPARRSTGASGETQRLIGDGITAGKAGDMRGAIAHLTKAVQLSPGVAEAHFHLGAALWYSGEKARAVDELDAAMRLNPASAEAYALRALAYRDANDLESASRMLQRAIAIQPQFQAGYFDLGVVFLRLSDFPHALGQFEAGLNVPAAAGPPPDLDLAVRELGAATGLSRSAEAHAILARMLGLAGADSKAVLAELHEAVRLRPDFAEAYNQTGLVHLQAGDDAQAIAAFRQAIQIRPDYADAHANLGATLTPTDAGESVRELQKAVELQPGLLKAQFNLAIAYGSSPRYGPAKEIEQLRKVLAMDANHPRAEFALGKALVRSGKVQEAVPHLERAVKAEPQFGEAQYQLGLALARTGRGEEGAELVRKGRAMVAASQSQQLAALDLAEGKAALARGEYDHAAGVFRRVLREHPGLAEAHYQLGVTLDRRGDHPGAAASYRAALAADPGRQDAQQALARAVEPAPALAADDPQRVAELESYFRERKFSAVQPLLEAYVRELPSSTWGWYALGYSLFAQQKIGESISALAKSLSLDVTNAEAHKVLGRDLMMIGRFDAAQKEFELAEKYDPKSAENPFNLGRLYSIQDLWAPARAAFERAVGRDGAYMEAYDGLGFALEALGEDEGAVAAYRKAIQLNEERKADFAAPYINLAAFYNRAGRTGEALEYARQAIAINAKADRAYFQLARAHERRGELETALDALTKATSLNSRVSSYYYSLATIYRRLGKQQESRDAMETFARLDRESNELEQKRRESLHPARQAGGDRPNE